MELRKYKYIKPNFYFFTILTFFSNASIYIIQFYLNKNKVDYFLCTDLKTYSYYLFSRKINLIYPESCDLKVYADGIMNIGSFYGISEFVYLDRPIFIIYIAFFYNILKIFISSISQIALLKISFFLGQLFLTSLICVYLLKIFKLIKLDIGKKFIFLPWLVSISPMFKWHIFESTSMTFTFLIFIIGILVNMNTKNINLNIYFFSIGLLFLIHRSALLILIFFVISNIITNSLNKKNTFSMLYFFVPLIFYYISIYLFSNYSDHQAEEYRQFVWIVDFLQGKETLTSGYFCQTPKLAVICYKNDLIKLFKYLAIPTSVGFLYFILNYKKLDNPLKNTLFLSTLFFIIINFFWLFIGWYPPIRFSYYGFGNFVIFILIIIFINIQDKISRAFFLFGYTFYFILLNHWNSPAVIELNQLVRLSIFFFICSLILEFYSKKLETR